VASNTGVGVLKNRKICFSCRVSNCAPVRQRSILISKNKLIVKSRIVVNPLALELDIYSLAHHLCKM